LGKSSIPPIEVNIKKEDPIPEPTPEPVQIIRF
jgi:hypothetical protein